MNYDNLEREKLVQALDQMEKQLIEQEKKTEELEEKAKRVKADFENFKKSEKERKEQWERSAQKDLADELIEVLDNLERAIATAEDDSGVVQGVKMVSDQLFEVLNESGLERIPAEGEEFDPRYHKAVDTEEHDEDDKILEERKKGYKFEDEVLREAEVVVGKNPEEE